MRKRTEILLQAARALEKEATTRSGNDEPTWLIPADQLMDLGDALDAFKDE